MTIDLSPELEKRVQAWLDAGELVQFEYWLSEALDRMEGRSEEGETPEEFEAALAEAHAQADRGETYSGAEVRAFLAQVRAERMRG